MLKRQEQLSWHDIMTLYESWFYLSADYELIKLQSDEEISERDWRRI
jgi:hypothetical protein